MTSAEIRQSFLDFFREKQHAIVPSASLLPDSPNLLFTNAGMNQFVPIFLGQQKAPWNPPRVADTQKCIRAGGKHNDLEDVGLDTYHHTFFEMLGNWSFGDYFKKEAIEWAWELVVERWELPSSRLYATVYQPGPNEPSEFDQEAHDHWARLFEKAGLDPAIHVVNGNKKDNFWMMGDTGPCGPCSELHIDLTPAGDTKGSLVNAGDPRCIEIWNLVFIQFNANADGTFSPLPQRHVDTGMGFERVTAMIQGTKGFADFSRTISNYETDVFRPIFDEIERLSGKKYGSTLPKLGTTGTTEQEKVDIAFRVIADHIRTLSFSIADGIVPSNGGRGYVLRRILRRAVRYGRTLNFDQPFFYSLVGVIANTMGDMFPELREHEARISLTIKREEEAFNETLDVGTRIFEEAVSAVERLPSQLQDDERIPAEFGASRMSAMDPNQMLEPLGTFRRKADGTIERRIAGSVAFKLYDTYGFPLDLTELMARERGFSIDRESFEKLMEEQRLRGRASQKKEVISIQSTKSTNIDTKFVGYDVLRASATVFSVLNAIDRDGVVVDVSPFYAEMGGQVGDTGWIIDATGNKFPVKNTVRTGHAIVLLCDPRVPNQGESIVLQVDEMRRRAIERHHTVTHLLHWGLHEIVSRNAVQKGSYVGPDKLTFDFSSAALTPGQKRDVERVVNEKIAENAPVSWSEIPYVEAKKRSDIQQFFGDKYGDVVRVVQIGGDPGGLNGYSMELCGGTHVKATGEIGTFRIVREEAIAAGIRRIEAVAGEAVRDWAKKEAERQREKFEVLARKKNGIAPLPELADNAEAGAILAQIDARTAHLEKLEIEVHEWEKQYAKASEADLKNRAITIANELVAAQVEKSCVAEVPMADAKLLQAIVDVLKSRIAGPIFLAGASDGRVALVASVPKELVGKIQANKLIQEVAPIVGGKGGGRPENAQGAGKDADKISEALARARELISI